MQPIGYQSGILAGILCPRAKKRYMLHLMDDPETQAFPSPDAAFAVLRAGRHRRHAEFLQSLPVDKRIHNVKLQNVSVLICLTFDK